MGALDQFWVWINDPLNWTNPGGVLERLQEHLLIMVGAIPIALVIAWPLGIGFGRYRGGKPAWPGIRRPNSLRDLWWNVRGPAQYLWGQVAHRGGALVVLLSNLTLAVPVLALLTVLPLTALGFGPKSVIVALAIFAIPPLLATAYTGMRQIDPEIRDAANGMGLSSWQQLWRVELPLAVPYLASGLRTAAVQVAATAALASFVNGGGLGTIIAAGFGLGIVAGGGQIIAGGLLVVALALTVEGIGATLQRLATPRPLRAAARRAS